MQVWRPQNTIYRALAKRRMKPENFMMNTNEILKLLDSKHFETLDDCAKKALAANAKPVLLEENQLIFSKLKPAEG